MLFRSRRQIVKKGIPLTEKELLKQDREQKEHVDKETRKHSGVSEEKRKKEQAKGDRKEEETLDEVFNMYDVRLVRREILEGVPALLLTFKTKPNYKPRTDDGKILKKIAGRAWVAEADHELVKIEAEVVEPLSIGAGLLARVQRGTALTFERRRINNEIWLPVKAEVLVKGRLMLFKGINLRNVTEFSEHRKYTVDTILNFGDVPLKPKP